MTQRPWPLQPHPGPSTLDTPSLRSTLRAHVKAGTSTLVPGGQAGAPPRIATRRGVRACGQCNRKSWQRRGTRYFGTPQMYPTSAHPPSLPRYNYFPSSPHLPLRFSFPPSHHPLALPIDKSSQKPQTTNPRHRQVVLPSKDSPSQIQAENPPVSSATFVDPRSDSTKTPSARRLKNNF